jgi:HAD superfamily hydrolase (TIGR01450 family)
MDEVHPSFLAWMRTAGDQVAGVLLDVDGTLERGGVALPRAAETLDWLHLVAKPFVLLTNDGNHSPEEKAFSLTQAGLPVKPEDIVSCSDAIVEYTSDHGLAGRKVFVMGDLGTPCYAERAGLKPVRKIAELADCAGVIVGEQNYDWEPVFNAVINYFIRNPESFLIVPNPDMYWPGKRGEIRIGAGGKARFIKMVLAEYGVELEPLYLGKPNPAIYRRAFHHLAGRGLIDARTPATALWGVGDSLRSDITGANRMGHSSALVLTGITPRRQWESLPAGDERCPTLVFEGL